MAVFQSNSDAAEKLPTWVVLDIADTTGSTDPNSLANGTVTMSGDYMQIPVSTSQNRLTLGAGYLIRFPFPGALFGNNFLGVRVTMAAQFTGAWGCHLGYVDLTDSSGIATGMRMVTSTSRIRPRGVTYANSLDGQDHPSALALVSRGLINTVGSFDGVDVNVSSACMTVEYDGETVGFSISNTGSPTPDSASTELCAVITHTGTTADTETLSVRFEYAIIPFPV